MAERVAQRKVFTKPKRSFSDPSVVKSKAKDSLPRTKSAGSKNSKRPSLDDVFESSKPDLSAQDDDVFQSMEVDPNPEAVALRLYKSADAMESLLDSSGAGSLVLCAPSIVEHLSCLLQVREFVQSMKSNDRLQDAILAAELWIKDTSRQIQSSIMVSRGMKVEVDYKRLPAIEEMKAFSKLFPSATGHQKSSSAVALSSTSRESSHRNPPTKTGDLHEKIKNLIEKIFDGEEPIPGTTRKVKMSKMSFETFMYACFLAVSRFENKPEYSVTCSCAQDMAMTILSHNQ